MIPMRSTCAIMEHDQIENLFRTPNGGYAFARWNRPIAPVMFGVEEQSIPILKGAIEATAELAGVQVQETDPEFGSNLMMFFLREWGELKATKDMDRLIPDLETVVDRLVEADAASYRFFRYDEAGGIKAAFLYVRMTEEMADQPAETIAMMNAIQSILTWGPTAFHETSPLGYHPESKVVVLKPEFADLIRAAYDPVMPVSADDKSHALRLSARLSG